jgi:hypothetical protein
MNSWDIFDTLMARRVVDPHAIPGMARAAGRPEIELERELCFPIAENVSQVRPDDILISDMHLPEAEIAALVREVTGLQNRVIVTPDGKASGRLWRELTMKNAECRIERHTGDNLLADFDRPREAGIPARLYLGARMTEAERQLDDQGFHRLAVVCREARLRTFNPEHRALELAQVDVNFPLLYLAARMLKPCLGGRRVLASARDCWLFQHLLRDVAGVDAVYWYSSRLARAFPSADYLDYTEKLIDRNTVLFDLCGTGWSLRRFADAVQSKIQNPPPGGAPKSKLEMWMLAFCGDEMNGHYEALRSTTGRVRWLIASASQGLEHNNLAPHPMVTDVVAGEPKYWNPTEFDWAGSPQIRAQHEAFHLAHRILGNYPEDPREPDVKPQTLLWLVAQLPELEFFPREDHFVQEELRRLADAHR